MKIKFAGASGGEVTGSKHLITFNGKTILLDCGMFQGKRQESDEKNRNLGFDAKKLDVMILSHAHIDHAGDIPYLYKQGYKGPIYCTHATRDLSNYMIMDSAFIQENELEFLKKKRKNKNVKLPELLYSMQDATDSLKLFRSVGYEQTFVVMDGVVASFYDAGHILGSALVHMIFYSKKHKKHLNLCFSGDLGRRGLPILRNPQLVPASEIMITECTYGNRLHAAIRTVASDLAKVVKEACERGGKIIIPAFALERTQEIVYYLNILQKKKKIPNIPIYVDSPLAGNVTEVFRSHPECFDKKVYKEFLHEGNNPFGFGDLIYTRSVEESKKLNERKGPMIIISASGMCEHGRILHHLKNNISDPKNIVLIVGYQAENTLGRKLVNGDKSVNIFGEPYDVKASIYVMDAFSAHADRSDLIDYIGRVKGLKKLFLVHGEANQELSFKESLKQNGFKDVYIPGHMEEIEIDFE